MLASVSGLRIHLLSSLLPTISRSSKSLVLTLSDHIHRITDYGTEEARTEASVRFAREFRNSALASFRMDRVLVNKLVIDQLVLSPAPWADSKHQVAYLDVVIYTDTSKAGATDDLNFSTSYAAVAKGLRKLFTEANYQNRPALTAHELAEEAAKWTLFSLDPPLTSKNDQVEVCATFPEALLHGGILSAKVRRCLEDFGRERILSHDSENARSDSLSIDSLEISTIIGLNDCEREEEQPLLVSLTTWPNFEGIVAADSMAWSARSLQQTAWKVRKPMCLVNCHPSDRRVLFFLSMLGRTTLSCWRRYVPLCLLRSSNNAMCRK